MTRDYNDRPADDTVRDDDSVRVNRYEETLDATKEREQAGEVRVSKDVVEERQQLDVPLEREEVQVRRTPVDRPATGDETAFAAEGETIRVPVVEERPVIRKEARVVEELEIDKRRVQDTEHVSDTVRKERFNVDAEGAAAATTRGAGYDESTSRSAYDEPTAGSAYDETATASADADNAGPIYEAG